MKLSFLLLFLILLSDVQLRSQSTIIDHNCCKLDNIPKTWVLKAMKDFKISYGHTSHGSQLITGIELIAKNIDTELKFKKATNYFTNIENTLIIRDRFPSGDLGNPNRTEWAKRTREMFNNKSCNINLVMWSWCGQASGKENEIQTYLKEMDKLEKDYPHIKFVYMTGHLDGSGVNGNLNQRNEQIRTFCKKNSKILFDFADIESYDPDGNYYLDKDCDDGCYYKDDNNQKQNWATAWCKKNPEQCFDCSSCAHSHCLNCLQKGKAFWWMMARIAGWDGANTVNNTSYQAKKSYNYPNPANNYINIEYNGEVSHPITLSIYNKIGIVVQNQVLPIDANNKSIYRLNTSPFINGVYSYSLVSSQYVSRGTFIIAK